jgi:hypothetical protein
LGGGDHAGNGQGMIQRVIVGGGEKALRNLRSLI